jgi:hypothetical protein
VVERLACPGLVCCAVKGRWVRKHRGDVRIRNVGIKASASPDLHKPEHQPMPAVIGAFSANSSFEESPHDNTTYCSSQSAALVAAE